MRIFHNNKAPSISPSARVSPSASIGVAIPCSGTHMGEYLGIVGSGHAYSYDYPQQIIISDNKRAYAFCKHCGKKFLFQEKHINTPLFDLSCDCGAALEIREE